MTQVDYKTENLIQAWACTYCKLCVEICPCVTTTMDGKLSSLYRLQELKKLQKNRSGLFQKLLGNKIKSPAELKEFSDTVFRCTLCGNCQEVCPVGINLKDLWLSLRQDMVDQGAYPPKVDMIRDNIAEEHNVFGEDNEERAEWVEDLDDEPEDGLIRDEAEFVYFTGCVSSFFPMAQKLPINLVEIMEVAGTSFTLLGPEEWCCGFPLLGAGANKGLQDLIDHNIESVKAKKASKILFTCPSCYHMWEKYYGSEFELIHSSQFLADLLKRGKLPLVEQNLTVTYHDPCDLGRAARVFDAPRDAINSLPGINFVEMISNGEYCQCCGGGGNLEMIDADLASELSKNKIREVLATGADAVVSACQQCVRTMTAYVRRNEIPLKVLDLTELVRNSLDVD